MGVRKRKLQPPLVRRAGKGPTAQVTVAPAGLELIERLAAEGQDYRTIAKALGINGTTLQALRKRSPDVQEAWELGQAALGNELTHHLLKAARKGNIVAAIYLSKARLGWREGDVPEARPNITINLPDAAAPEAYLRTIRVVEADQ